MAMRWQLLEWAVGGGRWEAAAILDLISILSEKKGDGIRQGVAPKALPGEEAELGPLGHS